MNGYTRRFSAQEEANDRWGMHLQSPSTVRLVSAVRRMGTPPAVLMPKRNCRFLKDRTYYRRMAALRGVTSCRMCGGRGKFLEPISEHEAEWQPCHACRVDPVYSAIHERIPLDDVAF